MDRRIQAALPQVDLGVPEAWEAGEAADIRSWRTASGAVVKAALTTAASEGLAREAAVLAALAGKIGALAVPRLLQIARMDNGLVASAQAMPDGSPLADFGLSRLPPKAWLRLGKFIAEVQAAGPMAGTALPTVGFSAVSLTGHMASFDTHIAPLVSPEEARRADALFSKVLAEWRPSPPVLAHGSLTASCLLFDAREGRLTGAFGFTEAALAPPAWDFRQLELAQMAGALAGYSLVPAPGMAAKMQVFRIIELTERMIQYPDKHRPAYLSSLREFLQDLE
ncbi:hypothetical protein FACS1894186_7930 [Alphaproteobacteria bacterium]|nr:hypothetical protein FACS1894186_7930 [Alphaproteobacteria bacterium]